VDLGRQPRKSGEATTTALNSPQGDEEESNDEEESSGEEGSSDVKSTPLQSKKITVF
jgi:hypothetical protein